MAERGRHGADWRVGWLVALLLTGCGGNGPHPVAWSPPPAAPAESGAGAQPAATAPSGQPAQGERTAQACHIQVQREQRRADELDARLGACTQGYEEMMGELDRLTEGKRQAEERLRNQAREAEQRRQAREQEVAEQLAQREQEVAEQLAQREREVAEQLAQREREAEQLAQRARETEERRQAREQEVAEQLAQRERAAEQRRQAREQEMAEQLAQRDAALKTAREALAAGEQERQSLEQALQQAQRELAGGRDALTRGETAQRRLQEERQREAAAATARLAACQGDAVDLRQELSAAQRQAGALQEHNERLQDQLRMAAGRFHLRFYVPSAAGGEDAPLETLRGILRQQGIPYREEPREVNGQAIRVVSVGPYASGEHATAAARRLQQLGVLGQVEAR